MGMGNGKENGPVLSEALAWCRERGVEFFSFNGNPTQVSWTASPKCYAHIYVDDMAFGCPLVPGSEPGSRPVADWSVIGPAVLAMVQKHFAKAS